MSVHGCSRKQLHAPQRWDMQISNIMDNYRLDRPSRRLAELQQGVEAHACVCQATYYLLPWRKAHQSL
jgi:hypothetical protein